VFLKSEEELHHKNLTDASLIECPDIPTGAASPNTPMSPEYESKQLSDLSKSPSFVLKKKMETKLYPSSQISPRQKLAPKLCLKNKKHQNLSSPMTMEHKFQSDYDKVVRYMKKKERSIGKSKFYYINTHLRLATSQDEDTNREADYL